jgi:hypothetical protein
MMEEIIIDATEEEAVRLSLEGNAIILGGLKGHQTRDWRRTRQRSSTLQQP